MNVSDIAELLAEQNIRVDAEGRSFEGDFFRLHGDWIEIQDEHRVQRTFIRADRVIAVTILAKP